MPASTPDPLLTKQIYSPEFTAEYPLFLAYVSRRLRRRDPDGTSGIQAEAIVSAATVACLMGARKWPPGIDFRRFFRRTLRSFLGHALGRRRVERERREGSPEPDELAAASQRAGEVQDARRKVKAVVGALAGDAGIEEMLGAMAEGAERLSDIEDMRGWSPKQTKAVRMRMNRRLVKAGLLDKSQEEAATRPDPKKVCP